MSEAEATLVPGTLEVLAGTPAVLNGLLAALPDEIALRTGAEDGWSPRDVLAHMLSVEPWALAYRIRLMLDEDDPVIPSVDEEDALEQSGFRERPIAWLLDEFERARAEHVASLRELSAEALERSGRHEQVGALTVANVVHHMAFHDLNHIRQIATMLEPAFNAGRGHMQDAY